MQNPVTTLPKYALSRGAQIFLVGATVVLGTIAIPFLRMIPFMNKLGTGAPVMAGGGLVIAGLVGMYLTGGIPIVRTLFTGVAIVGAIAILTPIAQKVVAMVRPQEN